MNFDKDLLSNLSGTSKRLFESLKCRQRITKKDFKYLRFEFRKTCNLGKKYLLPQFYKRLSKVPGRPVVLNWRALTEKVSVKDSEDFINKSPKLGKIIDYAILVTAVVVGLYPRIPHNFGLSALKESLDKRKQKKVPTAELVQMAEIFLKNNCFEFNNQIQQQIWDGYRH